MPLLEAYVKISQKSGRNKGSPPVKSIRTKSAIRRYQQTTRRLI